MWKISRKDPQTLTLAADSRLVPLDYTNDQIWELVPGGGDPAAILLQSTYGLRARNMRIFPQFEEAHKIVRSPEDFVRPLEISSFAPNYLRMNLSPFPGIDLLLEYWVPDCSTVAGRIRIDNFSGINRNVQLALCALLNPNTAEGQPMRPERMEVAGVLAGKTETLSPVLFITGGASSAASPYPALIHELSLPPGQFRRFTWVLASREDAEQSFRHARLTASQNFNSQIDLIEMQAAGDVEIFTGDPDWDLAFAMGGKTALSLIHSRTGNMRHPSFVSTRLPDQGFSQQGSGMDYNHLWNGQGVLESWYLMQYLLPGYPELAMGILRNFLSTQTEEGFIDSKPGLAGQRSGVLAMPLLTSIAWKIYQATRDLEFLEEVFHPLFRFVMAWFDPKHDRDGDGIPEWSSAIQSGFDENPTFCTWLPGGQGADPTLVESPDLCAYLYQESQLLLKMADLLGHPEPKGSLAAVSENLDRAVQSSWNSRKASYHYWDRETHQTRKGELLAKQKGSGEMLLDLVFELPARLLIRLESERTFAPKVDLEVKGRLSSGKPRTYKISTEAIAWQEGRTTLTLPDLYSEIEQVGISGLPADGKASLLIIDHTREDHTLLTPIWAGIPDEQQVEKIIQRKLRKINSYQGTFGLPACPKNAKGSNESLCDYIWLPWNVMVGEGLLMYGHHSEAAELISRMMGAIVENLKTEHSFRSHYHADEKRAAGQRNALTGLPPVGLFLQALGVNLISPWKVEISRHNPFPWPVRVKYRGVQIVSKEGEVVVTFPDGEYVSLDQQIPCMLEHQAVKEENN
jgi:hypothetical protein